MNRIPLKSLLKEIRRRNIHFESEEEYKKREAERSVKVDFEEVCRGFNRLFMLRFNKDLELLWSCSSESRDIEDYGLASKVTKAIKEIEKNANSTKKILEKNFNKYGIR